MGTVTERIIKAVNRAGAHGRFFETLWLPYPLYYQLLGEAAEVTRSGRAYRQFCDAVDRDDIRLATVYGTIRVRMNTMRKLWWKWEA